MYDNLHFAGKDLFIDETDLSPELLQDLKDCGAPGPADAAVAYILEHYGISGDAEDCKAFLRSYGAWEDTELQDHEENLSRLVWLTGCSLAEGEPAYFSGY